MKKVLAIVALVATMFIAGKAQAQSTIYAAYAPEAFVSGNNSVNYQGFFAGFSQNIGLGQGFNVAAGAQLRMNTRSESTTILNITTSYKESQTLIDVPILLNYGISINRDLCISPFAGPMLSLALTGSSTTSVGNNDVTENWYNDGNLTRFNLYAALGVNVRFDQFNVFGGYRWGMVDINKSDYITVKTNGMFIGLGFTL